MKQVNRHVDVDDNVSYSITNYSEDGYVGRTTDTVYSDGSSYTDWCEFVGTEEECQEYINKTNNNHGRNNKNTTFYEQNRL